MYTVLTAISYTALILPPVVKRTYPSRPRPSLKAEVRCSRHGCSSRLTDVQVAAEYRKLATLLESIKAIVEERTFGDMRASAVDNLPLTVSIGHSTLYTN